MHDINESVIASALYAADLDPEDFLYRDYAGRGMYGETCFGIKGVIQDFSQFIIALSGEGEEGRDIAQRLSQAVYMDTLGHGCIFYFPGFRLVSQGE